MQGLLSSTGASNYTPQPIYLNAYENATKPPPDWVNRDKRVVEQERLQKEADAKNALAQQKADEQNAQQQQQQQQQQKGGMSVLCTAVYALGYMKPDIYAADEAYGDAVRANNPKLMAWYVAWAAPLAKHMHGKTLLSRLLARFLWLFIRPWSKQMAYSQGVRRKGSLFGALLIAAGIRLSR